MVINGHISATSGGSDTIMMRLWHPAARYSGARWDIVGPAEVWKQVLDGVANLSVVCRARQLRYCDTGDVPPAVPGLRMAMLGELLGITTWQADEPGQPEPLAPDPPRADIFVR